MKRHFLMCLMILTMPSVKVRCEEAKPKARTLKDLTNLAMTQGDDDELTASAISLEIARSNARTKEIYIDQHVAPDGYEHVFHVLVKDSKPQGIVLSRTKTTIDGDKKSVDGNQFHCGLDGKLKHAVHGEGFVGEVVHTKLRLDSKTKKQFNTEVEFWTKDSIDLPWTK